MKHLSERLVAKVRTLIECEAEVGGFSDLMQYFTTEERGHGEIDYAEFLMQNDGNPPEGGTWTEQHITYEQLKALYDFCKAYKESYADEFLKLISQMEKRVLLSFPNVKESSLKKEISSKMDRRVKDLIKILRARFHVNHPRFWKLANGDIICQPNRRKRRFYQCYTNCFGGYWFSETLMAGNTAIMVKRAL